MRIFLDANILFTAAHNPKGKAALIIEIERNGVWQVATSPYAAEEARRNVARKFPACVERLEALLGEVRLVADAPGVPAPAGLAAKDAPIFRAAVSCRADVLLTGDIRDFGFLMNAPDNADGLLSQTVADFLAGREPPG